MNIEHLSFTITNLRSNDASVIVPNNPTPKIRTEEYVRHISPFLGEKKIVNAKKVLSYVSLYWIE